MCCQLLTSCFPSRIVAGAAAIMDHFHTALDPRKQELLEARFLGARVSKLPIRRRFAQHDRCAGRRDWVAWLL